MPIGPHHQQIGSNPARVRQEVVRHTVCQQGNLFGCGDNDSRAHVHAQGAQLGWHMKLPLDSSPVGA